MYNITDGFIEQIGAAGKEKDTKILIDNKEIIPQLFKQSFIGSIFTSIMQKIEIEVKNGEILKENTILKPKYGLKVNNKYEYIGYSDYNVYSSEINYDTQIVKTIAYDNLIKFMIKYEIKNLNISFPTTILELITKICEHIGVELYETDFFHADLSIEEDLFSALNCTYRDVINYICQATLTTAIIKDNKLYFKAVTDTNKIVTPQILKKFKLKQEFGGCNSLVLGRGNLNDNVYSKEDFLIEEEGLQEIRFDNNEILNKKREEVIDDMFNQIKGLRYYAFETKDLGIGIFEPADLCEMQDLDGNTYPVLILNQSLTVTSGCEGSMSANVPEVSTTKYQYATDSQKRQTKTEIIVDKQGNKITQLAQETTEHEERLTEAIQDAQKFKYSVNNSGGNNLIKNSVGWANLDFWEVEEDSNIVTNKSDEIVKNSLSKSAFQLNNGIMKQSFEVELNKSYSVGFKIKKPTIGSGYVQIIGDTVLHVFNFETGTAIDYESYNYTFTANTQVITVEIYSDCGMIITDLIANTGDILSQWQPYAQELYALGVQIDSNGIKTYDNISEQEVLLTPTGLTGKYKDKEVFKLNGDITETEKISAREEIDMNPIKIIAVSDGWDFVYVD